VNEYRRWCAENGFGRGLQKHWRQRCRERAHVTRRIAETRRLQKKQERRRPGRVIHEICRGRLGEDDVTQVELRLLCAALGERNRGMIEQAKLADLLLCVQSRTNLLSTHPVIEQFGHRQGNTYVAALVQIAAHHQSWLRPPDQWKPRTHNTRRQFASLLRHLFVHYDMPVFFDSAWFTGADAAAVQQQRWYLEVACGTSIRHCDLPIAYTKRMGHHFLQAPDDVTVLQALRWGQILALGGDARLARALLATRIGESFDGDSFWITVARWFIAHAMLDTRWFGPIVDYLNHQRFGPREPGAADATNHAPPQPNLTMKGRTADSLLRAVQAWHRELARDNTYQLTEWRPSGIDAFQYLEGSESGQNLKYWTIRELLGSKALFVEGRRMKHCVATYASSCARGASSIWTLELETDEGRRKLLTIEVNNAARLICQVRGKANRMPNDKERSILRRWATEAGLTVASYV
jgi:hypothetical protein